MTVITLSSGKQRAGMIALTVLRVGIGWHFLYEGFSKLIDPGWTAAGYLQSATGPLHPDTAFPYAFEKGADFVCAGMYDFQIVEDVNIALAALQKTKNRKRPWRA